MTARKFAVPVVLGFMLACSGLFGYGEEIGEASVQDGRPFKMIIEPATGEPHQVWLDYEVEHTSPYEVTGTIEVENKSGTKKTWSVRLTDGGSPIVGGSGRTTLNSKSWTVNGNGAASATIYMVELPPLPAGQPARVSGTLRASSGTTLKSARLVVTD